MFISAAIPGRVWLKSVLLASGWISTIAALSFIAAAAAVVRSTQNPIQVLDTSGDVRRSMPHVTRQKAHGVYYTPDPVVRCIVQRTLQPLLAQFRSSGRRTLRIVDPACGDGAFLTETYRYLSVRDIGEGAFSAEAGCRDRDSSGADRRRLLSNHLFGLDVDRTAVGIAKSRLAAMALGSSSEPGDVRQATTRLARALDANLRCGDALLGPDAPLERNGRVARGDDRFSWQNEFASVFRGARGGFDAVIGNPPYVNIRVLARSRGAEVRSYLRQRYQCAYRGYDLYVLFLEKAFELLRPGGRCGMIVPNKIAALDYARPCRSKLLREATLQEIIDVSDMGVFPDAGVYPYILIWEKNAAPSNHRVAMLRADSPEQLSRPKSTLRISQTKLSAETGFPLERQLDVESRVATQPLGRCVELHSGTTGFVAQELARSLVERDNSAGGESFEFIVSGNIDRYRVRHGDVRYMKRFFRRPVLPSNCELLSKNKQALFAHPKIVIAGMVRRLEAAWDAGGLSLGVQVYAAARPQDPSFLLGLLNSKLFSYLFRIRFPAKRLAGGFLAVNKGQLARLPVRVVDHDDAPDRTCHRRIVTHVRRIQELGAMQDAAASSQERQRLGTAIERVDGDIDHLVYQMYRLTKDDVKRVEAAIV